MANCLEFAYTSIGTGGQEYDVYLGDDLDPATCPNNEDFHVILDVSEYEMFVLKSELLVESQATFDTESYDFAYEGILQSWVIGLGVGFILAMIAKLKR